MMTLRNFLYSQSYCVIMTRAEFLKYLLKTGTSDTDLLQAGYTKATIKAVKTGRMPVTGGLMFYVLNRHKEMFENESK